MLVLPITKTYIDNIINFQLQLTIPSSATRYEKDIIDILRCMNQIYTELFINRKFKIWYKQIYYKEKYYKEIEIDKILQLLGFPLVMSGLELRLYNTEYDLYGIDNSSKSDALGFLYNNNIKDSNNVYSNKDVMNTAHDVTWKTISDYIDNHIYPYQPVWDTYADAYNYIASAGF
jgi:hypothetical protein